MQPTTAVMPAPWEASTAQDIRALSMLLLEQAWGQPGTADRQHQVSSLYLLRPGLQLLPLLQVDLPYTGQQVMRGHEDPGAQEKREDVCSLKKKEKARERGRSVGQAWWGPLPAAPLGPAGSPAQHPRQQPWFAWLISLWMLPWMQGTDQPHFTAAQGLPSELSSQQSPRASPHPPSHPKMGANPALDGGRTLQAWVSLLPCPACSLGLIPSLLLLRILTDLPHGPSWWEGPCTCVRDSCQALCSH